MKKVLFLGDRDSPIMEWLIKIGENVIQTSEKITPEYVYFHEIDFIVNYGYRHILRKNILDLLPNKVINLHISYLPFNRGADPNFWSFIENSPKGVTIHYLGEGIDTGDIIIQEKVKFNTKKETLATSYEKLQLTIQKLFKHSWQDIKNEKCKREKQLGVGSFHKVKDKNDFDYLLKDGWNTPLSVLEKYSEKNRS